MISRSFADVAVNSVPPWLSAASAVVEEVSTPTRVQVAPVSLSVFLVGNVQQGWEIIQPLLVRIEPGDDGAYVASDDISVVYGVSRTPSDAVRDYLSALIEYYRLLEQKARIREEDRPAFHRLSLYLRPLEGARLYAAQTA